MTILFSNSVVRRYTPPTCTLEIVAKASPLSRWMGQSALKELYFELCFDDPRQPEDKQVTIHGDQTELEILHEAVNSYVQEFLAQRQAQQMPLAQMIPTSEAISMPDEQLHQSAPQVDFAPPAPPPNLAQASSQQLNESENSSLIRSRELEPKLSTLKPQPVASQIYLQPRSVVAHELFLGQLATEESGAVVILSVLQLFDLATALDEYAAQFMALPNLNQVNSQKNLPIWTRAAAGIILAVGATVVGVKLLQQSESNPEEASPIIAQESATAPIPTLENQPTAESPKPSKPQPPTPLPTPRLPTPLASSPKLKPPAPVTAPNVSRLAAPPPQRRTIESITIKPKPPAATTRVSQVESPAPQIPSPIGSSSPLENSQTPTNISLITTKAPELPTLPSLESTPSPVEETELTPLKEQPLPSVTPQPSLNLPNLRPIPFPSEVSKKLVPTSAAVTDAPASEVLESPESVSVNNVNNIDSPAENNNLFDNIPQVAEVRKYLQQRWEPPSELEKTLEYSLFLNADGSIQKIIPLGKTAGEYIDQMDLPLVGEPFVSAVDKESNPRIRVVLSPDGQVQTFLQ
ncbi:MAG: DUF4335 domain-containing protein [Symploca sp. SIO2E9]|nr:DUF4335 domain-containing protein [Symploca sp. SIO2E9]